MTRKRILQNLGLLMLVGMIVMFYVEAQQDLGIYGIGDVFKYSLGLSVSFAFISLESFKNVSIKRKTMLSIGITGILLFVLYVLFAAFTQFSLPDGVSLLQAYFVYIAFVSCSLTAILLAMFTKQKDNQEPIPLATTKAK